MSILLLIKIYTAAKRAKFTLILEKIQKKCNAHATEIKHMCAPICAEEDTLHSLLSLII